jgi:hypothetical protein
MQAQMGDRIIAGTGSSSIGLIVGVLGDDGRPPYIVKWLRTGHIAMVTPGPYARVIPAGTGLIRPAATAGDGGRAADDRRADDSHPAA